MNEENNGKKNKRLWFEKNVVIIVITVLICGLGITGFVYANRKSDVDLEGGMQKLSLSSQRNTNGLVSANETMNVTETSSETTKVTASSKATMTTDGEIMIDQHKITLQSEVPTDTTITLTQAASIGLKSIKDGLNQEDDDCEIQMYHMNTYGAGKITGTWIGTTELNNQYRSEFRINDNTGEVIERIDYKLDTKSSNDRWVKINGDSKNEIIIEDNAMKAFSKMDVNLLYPKCCEVVIGDHYGICIRYNDIREEITYENDNGILKIKEKEIKQKSAHYEKVERGGSVTITVPKDAKFDSAHFDNLFGNIILPKIDITDLKINAIYGDVDLNKTMYQKGNIKVIYGDVEIEQAQINNSMIYATYGDLTINDTDMKDSTIKLTYGDLKSSNVTSNKFDAKMIYGDATATGELMGESKIKTDFGNINVGCSKAKTLYNYDLKCKDGEAKVDGTTKKKEISSKETSKANTIELDSMKGSCELLFGVDPKKVNFTHYEDWDKDNDREKEDGHSDNDWDDDDDYFYYYYDGDDSDWEEAWDDWEEEWKDWEKDLHDDMKDFRKNFKDAHKHKEDVRDWVHDLIDVIIP